jgi:glutamyl-tRNA synthetase
MINNSQIRSRFAPSPSGIIHIGNLRSALMSFLCAKENNGSFILRIEDTDQTRTQDYFLNIIYTILNIMKIMPDEGPLQGGDCGPYIQSQRKEQYDFYLSLFIKKDLVYRCFKTQEELEIIKNQQIALKLPPRYNRAILSQEEESLYLIAKKPFVWRFKVPNDRSIIQDKIKGKITYNLMHFADCPITRDDGSYTFLFANFVDDVMMNINYVIRGEEHLSNSAIQSSMYDALNIKKPLFYHLPLICDDKGKKLSKRNFGFNIQDLLEAGYLPEAILNYIAIIGGNFKPEIMSLEDMINNKIFSQTKSSGFITYDSEKLLWINMKWMQKIEIELFIDRIKIYKTYNSSFKTEIPNHKDLINDIKKESKTIKEFFINIDSIMNNQLEIKINNTEKTYILYIKNILESINDFFINYLFIKTKIKEFALIHNIEEKKLYNTLRKILIQKEEGISIGVLIKYINRKTIINNINKIQFL